MRRQMAVLAWLVAVTLPAVAGQPSRAAAVTLAAIECNRGPLNPPTAASYNLDRTSADWGVFCDRDSPSSRLRNVMAPALDHESLECAMTAGEPYAALHCYRNLISEPSASSFVLSTFFRFTPTTCNNAGAPSVVQGLEFTISKWLGGMRWELAVQLENVASSAGSAAPQWRWWDGHAWVAMTPTFSACLAADTWHYLRLAGSIVNGLVRYDQLLVDDEARALGMTAPPVASTDRDKLAVGFQLDANSTGSPYSLFADQVHFVRW